MIERPVPWPGGAKCAAAITFDIDMDSFLHLEYGERVPDMVCTTSWLRYDEIAVPRILKIYREFDLRQTFFFPAWCMEQHPAIVEMVLEGGHEIGHHGYLHENPNQLTKEDELYWLQRASDVVARMTGAKPIGYRAPVYNFSKHTVDLLAAEGFLYDATLMANDVPYVIECEAGRLIEIPSHWALDDWPQFAHNIELEYMMTVRSPEEAFAVYEAEFDAAYRHGGLWAAVWHPWHMGRLARADRLAQFIRKARSMDDVWFATTREIAEHVLRCVEDGSYDPAIVKLPYYDKSIPHDQRPVQNP